MKRRAAYLGLCIALAACSVSVNPTEGRGEDAPSGAAEDAPGVPSSGGDRPPAGDGPASAPPSGTGGPTTPVAPPVAGKARVRVLTFANTPKAGVPVLFHDPSGGTVLASLTTDASGQVERDVQRGESATVLLELPAQIPSAYTPRKDAFVWVGIAPGDDLVVRENQNAAASWPSSGGIPVTFPAGTPDTATYGTACDVTQPWTTCDWTTRMRDLFPLRLYPWSTPGGKTDVAATADIGGVLHGAVAKDVMPNAPATLGPWTPARPASVDVSGLPAGSSNVRWRASPVLGVGYAATIATSRRAVEFDLSGATAKSRPFSMVPPSLFSGLERQVYVTRGCESVVVERGPTTTTSFVTDASTMPPCPSRSSESVPVPGRRRVSFALPPVPSADAVTVEIETPRVRWRMVLPPSAREATTPALPAEYAGWADTGDDYRSSLGVYDVDVVQGYDAMRSASWDWLAFKVSPASYPWPMVRASGKLSASFASY